ncbi:MutS-related protein [Streptomyces halstedii]|uniref:MutS-related protein n=1 Tax=Streptomyces halstedii TaxID=1944 RepID=UPI0036B823E2
MLFRGQEERAEAHSRCEPAYFPDLNLDQILSSLTCGREAYDLAPFFRVRLGSVETIAYRQAVFRDLHDNKEVSRGVEQFAADMRNMRMLHKRAAELRNRYQQECWFIEAADTYCRAARGLEQVLSEATPQSRALQALSTYLTAYVFSAPFTQLTTDIKQVRASLNSIRYCMNIAGGKVTVTRYADEDNYGAEVLAAFEKFKQEEVQSYLVTYKDYVEMNHVEEAVLDKVAVLFPDEFTAMDDFCTNHRDHVDTVLDDFDREVHFYLSYLELTGQLELAGLSFCCPRVGNASKAIAGRQVFDLALAEKLVASGERVVPNDFHLEGDERVLVISGPNQGGKTTFARTIGQLHHLAALGCPVPGAEAQLFLCDQLFTHFEHGENLRDLSGKLHDDLDRIHSVLQQATSSSIVIMNEVFTSTTLDDALVLGTRVLEQIIERDLLSVCVTFVDELSQLGPATVSMTSTVLPDNPAAPTFRIVRRPADGISHALAIADRYGLTYERLKERLSARADVRATS